MIQTRPLTFQQALKKNLKRVLTYWAPLSVVFAGLGSLLGFYTLSAYATAIGRPDVMAAALEAKSALIPWLATVIGMLAAYLLILLSTTVLFGLTVSMFNKDASQQHKLVGILLLPVLVGIVIFLWQIFEGADPANWTRLLWSLGWLAIAMLIMLAFPSFRSSVDTCVSHASRGNTRSWPLRVWFMVSVSLLLIATVIAAVYPASLILKAYVGEDTPEAVSRLKYISIFAASVTLLPVVVFYVSKADLFKRLSLVLVAVIVTGGTVIGMSPGSPAAIVYAAAQVMNVRNPLPAQYMLTKTYAKEDFDTSVWGAVETVRAQPVVSAFPLFSFGDVLLLCPSSLATKGRKEWPSQSVYCVLTQSSTAVRMPKKAQPATACTPPTGKGSPECPSDASPT